MTEFDSVPEDASEATRQHLAERLAPEARKQMEDYPAMRDLATTSRRGKALARSVVLETVGEYYNRAQRDVLQRVLAILAEDAQS